MDTTRVGVLGATSLVGDKLLPRLRKAYDVTEMSRRRPGVIPFPAGAGPDIPCWISLIPIAALPNCFEMLTACGAKRIVALSSTSVFTKANSSDPAERALVDSLREGEKRFAAWAENQNIEWLILRPTLIYGFGRDRNVSDIARFIDRFGFFPIFGPGQGLRQPIHAEDVAGACIKALETRHLANCSYNISGAETLSYRDMVGRVFEALGRPARLVRMPLWGFRVGVACARLLPRFRGWSVAMAERMNTDMIFDRAAAERDLDLPKRPFRLDQSDLPLVCRREFPVVLDQTGQKSGT